MEIKIKELHNIPRNLAHIRRVGIVSTTGIVTRIIAKCNVCGRIIGIPTNITLNSFNAWTERKLMIQDAFPELDAGQRELLISGCCSTCFDELFSFDEDDDLEESDE